MRPPPMSEIEDMQLIPLDIGHIHKMLDIIVAAAIETLPPTVEKSETLRINLQGALLDGRIQAWGLVKYPTAEGENITLLGTGTTMLRPDEIAGTKDLLIYTLHAYPNVTMDAWRRPFETLREYARMQGCKSVIAYSQMNDIVKIVESLGGNARCRFLELEV